MIKPDAIKNKHVGDIFKRIEKEGLVITELRTVQATEELIKNHYSHLVDKPFFPGIVDYMTSRPVIVGVLEGESVIETWRHIMGATDPRQAEPGTLRYLYGDVTPDGDVFNVVHGSDSQEGFEKEISLWLSA